MALHYTYDNVCYCCDFPNVCATALTLVLKFLLSRITTESTENTIAIYSMNMLLYAELQLKKVKVQ